MPPPIIRGVPFGTFAPPSHGQDQPDIPAQRDYERFLGSYAMAPIKETTVYKTKQRWQACDVFVALPSTGIGGFYQFLTIAIYGVTQGVRTLLATGRTDSLTSFSTVGNERTPTWIAAARAQCDEFEVTITNSIIAPSPIGPGVPTPKIQVAVIASDEANDIPDTLGALPLSNALGGGTGNAQALVQSVSSLQVQAANAGDNIQHPPLQVVGVHAYNTSGNPGFLLLSDGAIAANGPVFGYGFPFGGSYIAERGAKAEGLWPYTRFQNLLVSACSAGTTPYTLTAVGQTPFQVWWR